VRGIRTPAFNRWRRIRPPTHERHEVHFLWSQDHPIEDLFRERIHEPDAVAPDRGCTGDVRDRMIASTDDGQVDDLEPHTRRAVTEKMSVSLLEKGGRYEVQSASGNRYEVDVISESCTLGLGGVSPRHHTGTRPG